MKRRYEIEEEKNEFKALVLTIVIHGLLFSLLIYSGIQMALPEGTIITEVEYISQTAPKGKQINELTDSESPNDSIEKHKKLSPPPTTQNNDFVAIKDEAKTLQAEDSNEKVIAPPPPKEKPKKKITPKVAKVDEKPKPEVLPAKKEIEQTNDNDTEIEKSLYDIKEKFKAQDEVDSSFEQSEYGLESGIVRQEKELIALAGNPRPVYPTLDRLRGNQGTTILQFEVLDDGSVGKIYIKQSSGHQSLDMAAANAQARWKYRSGKTGLFEKKVHFKLKGSVEEIDEGLRRGL